MARSYKDIYGPLYEAWIKYATGTLGWTVAEANAIISQGKGTYSGSGGTHLGRGSRGAGTSAAMDIGITRFGGNNAAGTEKVVRDLRAMGLMAFQRGPKDLDPQRRPMDPHLHIVAPWAGFSSDTKSTAIGQITSFLAGGKADSYTAWKPEEREFIKRIYADRVAMRARTEMIPIGEEFPSPTAQDQIPVAEDFAETVKQLYLEKMQENLAMLDAERRRLSAQAEEATLVGMTELAEASRTQVAGLEAQMLTIKMNLAETEGEIAMAELLAEQAEKNLEETQIRIEEERRLAEELLQATIQEIDNEIERLRLEIQKLEVLGDLTGKDALEQDIIDLRRARASLTPELDDDYLIDAEAELFALQKAAEIRKRIEDAKKNEIQQNLDVAREQLKLSEAMKDSEEERASRVEDLKNALNVYRNMLLATGDAIGAMRVELELLGMEQDKQQKLTLGQELISSGLSSQSIEDFLKTRYDATLGQIIDGQTGRIVVSDILSGNRAVLDSLLDETDQMDPTGELKAKLQLLIIKTIKTMLE